MSASLRITDLSKSFGGVVVTNKLNLDVPGGSLTAIIGPNGAGKTTLFNLITGKLKPDAGQILLDDVDLTGRSLLSIVAAGVGRAFQVANLFPTFTVRDAIAASIGAKRGRLAKLWSTFPEPELAARADKLVELVGLSEVTDRVCGTLSHGDQKLLDIAMALAMDPKLLLLDEPMAGMGKEERQAMMACIKRLWSGGGVTLVFIEHDMDVVFSLAQSVCVLQQGTKIASGSPAEIRKHPDVIRAYLGSDFE